MAPFRVHLIFFTFTVGICSLHPPAVFAVSDPSDGSCLSSLYSSLADSAHRLRNWTKPNLADPCNGFTSYIAGATCNNGRIYKLSLPNLSLSGQIPALLSNCTNLQTLDLSSNSLVGPIPTQLSSLINLAVLNLSSNRLSGQIPEQLGLLVRLSAFDVSYNDLEGPIPVVLANRSAGGGGPRFNASSFAGNRGLYGYPLPPVRGKGLSVMAIVGIGLGSGLLSLLISFTAVCIWLRVTERAATVNGGDEGKISHYMPEY